MKKTKIMINRHVYLSPMPCFSLKGTEQSKNENLYFLPPLLKKLNVTNLTAYQSPFRSNLRETRVRVGF